MIQKQLNVVLRDKMVDTKKKQMKEEEDCQRMHLKNIQNNMQHLCRNKFEKNCRSKKLNGNAKFELTSIGMKAKKKIKSETKEASFSDGELSDEKEVRITPKHMS
jgi:hypothetical protein